MDNTIFILGAADPEMAAIEQLLKDCGTKCCYALDAKGERVHGGNAYKATRVSQSLEGIDKIVLVECEYQDWYFKNPPEVVVIDHHRPRDPGYGKPPADFMSASSIGQVIKYLALEAVPKQYVLTAAADHCLAAAYAGKCPGVDPEELMTFRTKQRAEFQGRKVSELLKDIAETSRVLRERSIHPVDAQPGEENIGYVVEDIVYMTDRLWPELPEAACWAGVAYVAIVTEPQETVMNICHNCSWQFTTSEAGTCNTCPVCGHGDIGEVSVRRQKYVLGGCTTPRIVENFLSDMRAKGRETYGDPQRGFAGAYK